MVVRDLRRNGVNVAGSSSEYCHKKRRRLCVHPEVIVGRLRVAIFAVNISTQRSTVCPVRKKENPLPTEMSSREFRRCVTFAAGEPYDVTHVPLWLRAVFMPGSLRDPTDLSYSSESCRPDELSGRVLCSFGVVISVLCPLRDRTLLPVRPMSESMFEYHCSCRRPCVYGVRDIRFRVFITGEILYCATRYIVLWSAGVRECGKACIEVLWYVRTLEGEANCSTYC